MNSSTELNTTKIQAQFTYASSFATMTDLHIYTQAKYDALLLDADDEFEDRKCPTGDYTAVKNFGKNRCLFDRDCIFGDNSEFPSYSNFSFNCTFGNNCKFGEMSDFHSRCTFGNNCCFDKDTGFASKHSFGNGCYFGRDCSFNCNNIFGNFCMFKGAHVFGQGCTFGNHCVFESSRFEIKCKIGEYSKFENSHFDSWCKIGKNCIFKKNVTFSNFVLIEDRIIIATLQNMDVFFGQVSILLHNKTGKITCISGRFCAPLERALKLFVEECSFITAAIIPAVIEAHKKGSASAKTYWKEKETEAELSDEAI